MNRELFGEAANAMALGRYYQGGFESPMTRREASLILGVRYVYSLEEYYQVFMLSTH